MKPIDRAVRCAHEIAKLVAENGGTGHHAAAAVVTLPASIFDDVARSAASDYAPLILDPKFKAPDGEMKIGGIKFVRGDDEITIRARAREFSGT